MGCTQSGQPGKVSAPKAVAKDCRQDDEILASESKTLLANPSGQLQSKVAFQETPEVGAVSSWGQHIFDGTWSRGVINGETMTWNDGTISSLRIDTLKREMSDVTAIIEMIYEGATFKGELRDNGKIHWDDGDVWTRQQGTAEAGASACALGKAPPNVLAVEENVVAAKQGLQQAPDSRPIECNNQSEEAALQANCMSLVSRCSKQVDEGRQLLSGEAKTISKLSSEAPLFPAAQQLCAETSNLSGDHMPKAAKLEIPQAMQRAPRKERDVCCC